MQHSTPSPNQADKKRFELLHEIGCVACSMWGFFSPCQIHHLLSGGIRRGHLYTIPLCPYHHVGQVDHGRNIRHMATLLGPSLALESKRFHLVFGSDDELLAKANEAIGKLRRIKDGNQTDHGDAAGDPPRGDAG